MKLDIETLVSEYLSQHPGYKLPPEQYRNPAVIAMAGEMKAHLMERCGGPLPFYEAILRSGQASFQPGETSDAYRLFRTLFEIEGNTFWNGRAEFEALSLEYNRWRVALQAR